jgi:hypothetical protein
MSGEEPLLTPAKGVLRIRLAVAQKFDFVKALPTAHERTTFSLPDIHVYHYLPENTIPLCNQSIFKKWIMLYEPRVAGGAA